MSSDRFASVSNEEIKRLKDERHAINTRKATESAMRTLTAYVKEKNIDFDPSVVTKTGLNTILERFFVEARKENGEHYKKSGLQSLRAGIHRYFKQNRGFEMAKEECFVGAEVAYANEVYVNIQLNFSVYIAVIDYHAKAM